MGKLIRDIGALCVALAYLMPGQTQTLERNFVRHEPFQESQAASQRYHGNYLTTKVNIGDKTAVVMVTLIDDEIGGDPYHYDLISVVSPDKDLPVKSIRLYIRPKSPQTLMDYIDRIIKRKASGYCGICHIIGNSPHNS